MWLRSADGTLVNADNLSAIGPLPVGGDRIVIVVTDARGVRHDLTPALDAQSAKAALDYLADRVPLERAGSGLIDMRRLGEILGEETGDRAMAAVGGARPFRVPR